MALVEGLAGGGVRGAVFAARGMFLVRCIVRYALTVQFLAQGVPRQQAVSTACKLPTIICRV